MSRLGIIDTHAHLDDNRFDSDRAAVMERLANDMEAVITQGTTLLLRPSTWRSSMILCMPQ